MKKKIKYPLVIINIHLSAPLKVVKIRAFYNTYNQGKSRLCNIHSVAIIEFPNQLSKMDKKYGLKQLSFLAN